MTTARSGARRRTGLVLFPVHPKPQFLEAETMATDRPWGVLVDAYSTGNYLPAAFGALGFDLVHLRSTPDPLTTMVAPDPAGYREFLAMRGESTVELLAERKPAFVVAGQEPGVPLADRLSEVLGLRTNGSALSQARRDKSVMIETVGAAGLRTAAQLVTKAPGEAVRWADVHGHWPCVAKPLSSASTDGVFVCRSRAELERAFERIISSTDIFGTTNSLVLVQSYLQGTEYIVDTVSCDGRTRLVGIWRYEKRLLDNGKPIYNRDILVDPSDEVCDQLHGYVVKVLDALGIQNGPAHAEVIVGPDGPALVEIGARLNGNMHPGMHASCLGSDQAQLTALAYGAPEVFLDEHAGRPYAIRQPAVVYNAPTSLSGTVTAVDDEVVGRIRSLPSVVDLTVKKKPGDPIRPTEDLLTSPLRVFLTSKDPAQLEADYREIARLRETVYGVTS
ncbi:ATP-grasp domain-containing protein [Nonomuraea typhae]|uniref:ATP-grasp domain-containing protein n=1 Tax=Nonomuraea typhae TaxID=2603600 RepID=A0ABW7ZCH1_9ACTN